MNTPIEGWKNGGSLTMCGLDDFMKTMEMVEERTHDPVVVTLCDKPHRQWHGETYCHYLSYKKFTPLANWTAAAQKVMKLLDEGRDVVLHCIHGRDRTGTIAYVVLRGWGNIEHDTAIQMMYEARPSRVREWRKLMKERQSFHDVLLKSLD